MNMHPVVLFEIVRQRQLNLLDDAKQWSRSNTAQRREHRRRPSD